MLTSHHTSHHNLTQYGSDPPPPPPCQYLITRHQSLAMDQSTRVICLLQVYLLLTTPTLLVPRSSQCSPSTQLPPRYPRTRITSTSPAMHVVAPRVVVMSVPPLTLSMAWLLSHLNIIFSILGRLVLATSCSHLHLSLLLFKQDTFCHLHPPPSTYHPCHQPTTCLLPQHLPTCSTIPMATPVLPLVPLSPIASLISRLTWAT